MLRGNLLLFLIGPLALQACAGGPAAGTVCDLLSYSPGVSAARIQMADDEVIMVAAPVPEVDLPRAVRTTFDAIAPGGTTTFVARERGMRGTGFRIEKRYQSADGENHTRSVLADENGNVLERTHSIPVRDVPQHVLATALRSGNFIDEAHIVSGPLREEYWSLILHDRQSQRYVVHCDLDGTPLRRWRRTDARVDAAIEIR